MKRILITGASKGIGEACALRLAGRGHRVFAGVRDAADGARLEQAGGGRIRALRLDVTSADDIRAAAAAIADETDGALDGVVNNAGIAIASPLEFLPIDELRRQLEINVIGQVAVTQAVLPLIRKATGRVVFIGSVSGRSALPFTGAYAASKFALEAITDALRIELRPWQIQVAIIEPGVITTPIWNTALAAADRIAQKVPPEAETLYGPMTAGVRRSAERAARGRHGQPPDAVAQAVEHALTARRARIRYVIGRDARIRLVISSFLPVRARDKLIEQRIRRL